MKLKNPMLVVTDIDKSVAFYKKVFGLHVIMDFGANKTLTGGLALQTVETYKDFIRKNDIRMTNLLSLKQQEVAEMANEDKKDYNAMLHDYKDVPMLVYKVEKIMKEKPVC